MTPASDSAPLIMADMFERMLGLYSANETFDQLFPPPGNFAPGDQMIFPANDSEDIFTSPNIYVGPNSTLNYPWEPGNTSDFHVLTKDELYLRLRPYQIAILSVAYALVFFLGVIGNALVIAVVVRYPSMQSVTNVFIANLAIADLLVVVICLPVNLIQSIFVGEYTEQNESISLLDSLKLYPF